MYKFRKKSTFLFIALLIVSALFIFINQNANANDYGRNNYLVNTDYDESSIFISNKNNDIYKKFLNNKINETIENQNEFKKSIKNKRLNSLFKKNYIILEYTKIFGTSKFCQKYLDNEILRENSFDSNFQKFISNSGKIKSNNRFNYLDDCIYKNCFFTCNKEAVRYADALLFHYGDFINELKTNKQEYDKLINQRDSKQIWMLWQDEAYGATKDHDYMKFNWTISYYINSEISYFAYGGAAIADDESSLYTIDMIRNEFRQRSNSAVWFVSNCRSKYRIEFTSQLGEYFPITVNGGCTGKMNKSINSKINFDQNPCPRESKCELNFLSNNKFYLAFESTNCSDYITEKFWRTLSYGLIPVVIQPSKSSYERIAPPDSFIHAQDFNYDSKLLANYLERVSTDFDLYLKHLNWKRYYKAYYIGDDNEPRRLCQLCAKLNHETSSIYYESLSSWFNQQCNLA